MLTSTKMFRGNLLLHHLILFCSIFVFSPSLAISATVTGRVVSVADGDTITILTQSKRQVRVRLYGIDTPEKSQAYGRKAKKFTASLVAGKTVTVSVFDQDKYGRTVGVVFAGRINVNEEIVRAGYAWQYRKYCKASFCSKWLSLEDEARAKKTGLFADAHPQPPWQWRKARKSVRASPGVFSSGADFKGIYHGNVKSHVFHGPGCRYFNCKNCTRQFSSKSEAIKSGYRPHRKCVK